MTSCSMFMCAWSRTSGVSPSRPTGEARQLRQIQQRELAVLVAALVVLDDAPDGGPARSVRGSATGRSVSGVVRAVGGDLDQLLAAEVVVAGQHPARRRRVERHPGAGVEEQAEEIRGRGHEPRLDAGRPSAHLSDSQARLASCSAICRRTSSMSRPRTAVISSSSAGAGSAPAWRKTRMPSRNAIRVGIELIWSATGEHLLGLGVDAGERDVAVRLGRLLVDGREHPARAAPGRPEVDQHDAVLGHRLLEGLLGQGKGGHHEPFRRLLRLHHMCQGQRPRLSRHSDGDVVVAQGGGQEASAGRTWSTSTRLPCGSWAWKRR